MRSSIACVHPYKMPRIIGWDANNTQRRLFQFQTQSEPLSQSQSLSLQWPLHTHNQLLLTTTLPLLGPNQSNAVTVFAINAMRPNNQEADSGYVVAA